MVGKLIRLLKTLYPLNYPTRHAPELQVAQYMCRGSPSDLYLFFFVISITHLVMSTRTTLGEDPLDISPIG